MREIEPQPNGAEVMPGGGEGRPRCVVQSCHDESGLSALVAIILFGIGICAFGLCGCAVGPHFRAPQLDVPAGFRGAPSLLASNTLAELPWWDLFKDPDLKSLLQLALTNNYDVRTAVSRVEQARAIVMENRALFLPQVNYGGEASRGKNASPAGPLASGGKVIDTFAIDGTVAWEIDLWGRIRRLNESARAQFLASRQSQVAVSLSVLSQTAQAYFRLLALEGQLAIARRSTNSFGESLRIFGQRLEQGVVSKLETSAAQAALSSAAASVPDLERQIAIQENLITVLCGHNPGPVEHHLELIQQEIAFNIPPGLPSELIRRRPDILQTEQLLRSANAQVGVAVANFFPQLSLTALFGQVSPELSALTSGAANAWSVAANATGPLFQGGRLVGAYRQAKAARDEAELHYRSTVLAAFQEVADALVAVQKFGEARIQQAQAVQAYQVAVEVSMQRYVAGRASYFEVLQEQQQLFPAENALVQIRLNQLLALVQLYQSLGGGFGLP